MQYKFLRLLDLVLAIPLLFLLSPILAVLSVCVWCDLGAPVFFRQERLGVNGKRFKILKFRTMTFDKVPAELAANTVNPYAIKLKNDPRITRFGGFLRKTSLDELPQLLNVFLGNMSLVGPRPFVPEEYEGFPPEWRQRLTVKPGLTGVAQISGRSDLSMEKIIQLDLSWVKAISIKLYVLILFSTALYMFRPKNVY